MKRKRLVFSAHRLLDPAFSPTAEEEKAFFSSITLQNGVFKTTQDRRMDDLNALVVSIWKEQNFEPKNLLDVGASSCISTLEWFESLRDSGFNVRITATDLQISACLKSSYFKFEALVDADGYVVQFNLFGLPLSGKKMTKSDYFVKTAPFRIVANTLWSLRKITLIKPDQEVLLVSPRARKYPEISFQSDNILVPNKKEMIGKFDAVRVANLLNLGYFSPETLAQGVNILRERLRGEGSFLIVNRTLMNPALNHGTVFRLNSLGKFEVLGRIGDGSEIEQIVLSC